MPAHSNTHPCCPRCRLPHENTAERLGWRDLCDACEHETAGAVDDAARLIEDAE